MWKLILFSVLLIGLSIAAIAIKLFVKKDGEFRKSCTSVNPATGKPFGCTCGVGNGGESCENKQGG